MNTKCPHCQASDKQNVYDFFYENNTVNIVKCTNCHHIYLFFEKEIQTKDLYSTHAYSMDDQRKSIFYRIQRKEYSGILRKIKKLLQKQNIQNPNLLDFGSGKGHFLFFAKEMEFKTFGVETAEERADFSRQTYGLQVSTDYYDGTGKINNSAYDVITMFHVLEHLDQPEVIFKGLFNINLKDNGIMVVEVPNFNSWQSKIGGKYWLHLDVPRHINHYTPMFLKSFATKMGATIVKQESFSLHLGIIGMLQSLMSLVGYKRSLIEDLKFKKSFKLVFYVSALIIPATLLEVAASAIKKGGIIRLYMTKQD